MLEDAPQEQGPVLNVADDRSESPMQPLQDPSNLFSFDEMLGLDVFEFFDPDFDLDSIDAFLEGNLDLSFLANLP